MHYANKMHPSKEQVDAVMSAETNGAFYLLNFLKFKPLAVYEDGRDSDLTGEQAYEIYVDAVRDAIAATGGRLMLMARLDTVSLGEIEELWDRVSVVMYPSRVAFLEMLKTSVLDEVRAHRTAGLAGQINIEMSELSGFWSDMMAAQAGDG